MLHVVPAGHDAVHPVEGGRLGRPQICAAVLDLVVAQRPDPPVALDRRFEPDHPVRGRGRGGQVLHPVLGPAHRPAGGAGREGDGHHVGEGGLLDPEAPPRMASRAEAEPRPRHPERARHDRMEGIRPLEVRVDLVHPVAPEPGGGDHHPLDGGAHVARVADLDPDPVRRGAERGLGVAVAEDALVDEVRARPRPVVEHRGRRAECFLRVHDRGPGRVLDPHALRRVLREIAVARHHHRHRFPDVTHPAGREAAVLHRGAHHDEERIGPAGRVRPGEYRVHAVHRERIARIDRHDVRVRVRRAHEVGVACAGRQGRVVREFGLAGHQGRVLDPRNGASDHPLVPALDPSTGRFVTIRGSHRSGTSSGRTRPGPFGPVRARRVRLARPERSARSVGIGGARTRVAYGIRMPWLPCRSRSRPRAATGRRSGARARSA